MRHAEVHAWFAGRPVYAEMQNAVYPPATYALLWPFLGWLPLREARWFWAVTTLAALAWMTWLIVRASGARKGWQTALAALMLLAMNQTGVAVGNGQLILHVMPPLVAGLLLMHRGRGSWRDDLIASACVTFALVKVTLTVPFLWLVLLAPRADASDSDHWRGWRWRPAVCVAVMYAALTAFAMMFQSGTAMEQLRAWLDLARAVASAGGDYANVHTWLTRAGLTRFMLLASALIFIGLGVWLYRHRDVDLWIRLGVVALVARGWTYHRLYDDVLVVLALVPLFRMARTELDALDAVDAPAGGWETSHTASSHRDRRGRMAAAVLLGSAFLVMLLPARLGTMPGPWRALFNGSHALVWAAILALLVWRASQPTMSAAR